jgi:hypothetical protein
VNPSLRFGDGAKVHVVALVVVWDMDGYSRHSSRERRRIPSNPTTTNAASAQKYA